MKQKSSILKADRGIFFAWGILPFMNNTSIHKHNRILKMIGHLIASNTNMSYCSNKHIKFKTIEKVSGQFCSKRMERKIYLGQAML